LVIDGAVGEVVLGTIISLDGLGNRFSVGSGGEMTVSSRGGGHYLPPDVKMNSDSTAGRGVVGVAGWRITGHG
jgi:hypothetical protein